MFAVLDGPAAFVKSLLQAGASKEAKDRVRLYALRTIMKYLIVASNVLPQNGDTALVWAKRSGRPDLVALLDC